MKFWRIKPYLCDRGTQRRELDGKGGNNRAIFLDGLAGLCKTARKSFKCGVYICRFKEFVTLSGEDLNPKVMESAVLFCLLSSEWQVSDNGRDGELLPDLSN